MRLRRYQRDGVRAMLKFTQKRSAVYLADEMGLGKTPQAIVYARVIRAKKVLVICPASVVLKWAREFKTWHRGRKIIIPILKPTDLKLAGAAEVVVCSYTRAAMDKVIGVLGRYEWDALILDEAHYCVAPDTPILTVNGWQRADKVKIGDVVYSFANNELRTNRITAKFWASGRSDSVCKMRASNGRRLECLGSHKILDENYVWKKGERFHVSDSLPAVREDILRQLSEPCGHAAILRAQLCEDVSLQRDLVGDNEAVQSDEEGNISAQDEAIVNQDGAPSQDSGGQWPADSGSSKQIENVGKAMLPQRVGASGVPCIDRAAAGQGLSNMLQVGRCIAWIKDRIRGGRAFSWRANETRTRSKEGSTFTKTRLVNHTIYKQGDLKYSGIRFVDFEVERDANYIANGFIVHNCKNGKAQRSQACLRYYWPRAKRQICVSGTPLPNSVMDGFLLFNKILPEVFANRYKFGFRYTNAARNHFTGSWEFKGGRNMKELAHLVRKHFMVRRLQRDVLSELPEILFTKNYCRIAEADQYKLSDEEQSAVLDAIAQGSFIMASEHIMTIKRGLGIAKVGAAWNQIDDLMRAGDMPRLVVFSYHREVIERLKELCAGKYRTLVLDGSVSSEKRDKITQEFQGDNPVQRVLLAQITAAGIGIDLTAADTAVFVEFDWTPANISQAYKRLHRMGQERRVNIIYLIAEGTLDEQITASLLEKAKVTAQALRG